MIENPRLPQAGEWWINDDGAGKLFIIGRCNEGHMIVKNAAKSPQFAALNKIANMEIPPADNSLETNWHDRLYAVRTIARKTLGLEDD